MDGSEQDPSILNLVLEGFADGRLWITEATPVWMGLGSLEPCVVCGLTIGAGHYWYDVPGPRGTLPAHVDCYRVWQGESDRRRDNPRP
jgi:hypothetical protein